MSDKHDEGKLDLSIIPPEFIEAVARVFMAGAEKYERDGYLAVMDAPQRYYAALRRHLHRWELGEENDQESGLHHFAHAGANVAILIALEAKKAIGRSSPGKVIDNRDEWEKGP